MRYDQSEPSQAPKASNFGNGLSSAAYPRDDYSLPSLNMPTNQSDFGISIERCHSPSSMTESNFEGHMNDFDDPFINSSEPNHNPSHNGLFINTQLLPSRAYTMPSISYNNSKSSFTSAPSLRDLSVEIPSIPCNPYINSPCPSSEGTWASTPSSESHQSSHSAFPRDCSGSVNFGSGNVMDANFWPSSWWSEPHSPFIGRGCASPQVDGRLKTVEGLGITTAYSPFLSPLDATRGACSGADGSNLRGFGSLVSWGYGFDVA